MTKKYLAITGVLALAFIAAGCGGKTSDVTPAPTPAVAESTPTPVPEVTEAPTGNLVSMEKVTAPDEYSDVENFIGEKTDSASRVLIINQTGEPIEHIFIRAAAKDDGSNDDWGTELIHSFEWPDQEKALYYYENNQVDLEGNTATSYDIRVSYEDINKEELYFRNLPLPLIKELRLCLDISGNFGVPYAKYITINGNREYSTLQEVRVWYGLDVADSGYNSSDESETDASTNTNTDTGTGTESSSTETVTPAPAAVVTPAETPASDVTPAPADTGTSSETGQNTSSETGETTADEPYEEPDPGASAAESYVGQSLGSLTEAMGGPSDSEYADEPGIGQTGYHHYGNFTVSTSVDDDGNETITGIW